MWMWRWRLRSLRWVRIHQHLSRCQTPLSASSLRVFWCWRRRVLSSFLCWFRNLQGGDSFWYRLWPCAVWRVEINNTIFCYKVFIKICRGQISWRPLPYMYMPFDLTLVDWGGQLNFHFGMRYGPKGRKQGLGEQAATKFGFLKNLFFCPIWGSWNWNLIKF